MLCSELKMNKTIDLKMFIIFIGITYYEFIKRNAYIQIFKEHLRRITFIMLLSVLLV